MDPQRDLDRVRERFPALDGEWALFDNAGGSAPCRAVIDRVAEHMARRPVQLGASYPLSVEATAAVEAGRAAMGRLVKAPPEHVVIGPSTTVNVARLAEGLGRTLRAGDEVVVTNVDHEANAGPWRRLEERGAVLREWRMRPETHALHAEDLAPLLGERTRVVAFCQVSNLFGTLHDVPAACALAREAGALTVVDAVAGAPHRRPDAGALGADVLLFSAYKTFGPHQGVLVARPELLEELSPPYHDFLPRGRTGFEPAGVCYELAAALPGIVEHLEWLGAGAADPLDGAYDWIARHEAQTVAPLVTFLAEHPKVTLLGEPSADPTRRVPTVSFTVEGRRASELPPLLDERRLAVRWGHFYAHRPARDLGLLERDGVVRASLVHYNTPAEVARLVEALDALL